jgi:hypothetical protein
MPLARVNSQLEPAIDERRLAANLTTMVVVAPSGSTPPSGTTIVWPSMLAFAASPSTVTERRCSAPSLAITVLRSRRSMPSPEWFRALIVTLPASRRSATARRTATS